MTAAHGRIMDVDIAAESSNLAKQQILVQASAAMTAQATRQTMLLFYFSSKGQCSGKKSMRSNFKRITRASHLPKNKRWIGSQGGEPNTQPNHTTQIKEDK